MAGEAVTAKNRDTRVRERQRELSIRSRDPTPHDDATTRRKRDVEARFD